jgi:predicted outer membrane repeat protein
VDRDFTGLVGRGKEASGILTVWGIKGGGFYTADIYGHDGEIAGDLGEVSEAIGASELIGAGEGNAGRDSAAIVLKSFPEQDSFEVEGRFLVVVTESVGGVMAASYWAGVVFEKGSAELDLREMAVEGSTAGGGEEIAAGILEVAGITGGKVYDVSVYHYSGEIGSYADYVNGVKTWMYAVGWEMPVTGGETGMELRTPGGSVFTGNSATGYLVVVTESDTDGNMEEIYVRGGVVFDNGCGRIDLSDPGTKKRDRDLLGGAMSFRAAVQGIQNGTIAPGVINLTPEAEEVSAGTGNLTAAGAWTIKGNGKVVSLRGNGRLLGAGAGVEVRLEGLTLKGSRDNLTGDGLVTVTSGGKVVMGAGAVVTDNRINSGTGAGVQVTDGVFEMEEGSEVSECVGINEGGGVSVKGGTFNLKGGEIRDNISSSGNGGGVYVSGGGSITISGGTITANSAGLNGGGVFVTGGNLRITDGVITDNTADSSGGGVYVTGGVTISATFSVLNGTADTDAGGGVSSGNVTISGTSSILNNRAGMNGGGVYGAGSVTISGTASIRNNTSGGRGGGVFCPSSSNIKDQSGTIINNTNAELYRISGNMPDDVTSN